MKAVKTFAIGAVGLAALFGASAPAAAQYYPGNPYGYGYNNPGNVIGQVINQVLNPYGQSGYGGYGVNPQVAVNQCTAAIQQRLQYRGGYGGYGGYGGQGGYGGYGGGYGSGRVLGITRVEQRSATTIRVRGYATSGTVSPYYPGDVYNGYGGYGGYGSYGAYGGYGYAGGPADLIFRCDVDYRGYIRDIDIDRRN